MDEQLTQKINEAAKEFSDALGDSYQALTTRTASTQEQVAAGEVVDRPASVHAIPSAR